MSARKDIVSTSLKIIISSWCLIPHWYTAGERCKRMFVKITCLHETCWLIIISTSCLRNSFNFSPNKAENFHLTDRFRKRLSLSKSLPLHSPFQFQFRTGIRNTYVDQIQVNLIIGHTANIVGFHLTSLKFKLQNYRPYRDFTFTMYLSSWKQIFIQIFASKGSLALR